MKVTERLQHATAAKFFAGLALAILPASALGQIVTESQPYDPVANNSFAATTAESAAPDSNQVAQLEEKLLEARRAIAVGNVPMAEQYLAHISSLGKQTGSNGDSAATIRTLINRQNELIQLFETRDPAYNLQAAEFLLTQANALLQYGDFENVESLIGQAQRFPVQPGKLSITPESLTSALAAAKAGVDNNPRKPQVAVAAVLSLMSKAQLAFDQGNLESAQLFVAQAKAYGVADNQLPPQQTMPWQLELKIQEAMRSGGQVVAASAAMGASGQDVVNANYDPENDSTRNIQVASNGNLNTTTPGITNPGFAKIPGKGQQYFEAGMAALRANDLLAARKNFEMAWQNREQLDAAIQQVVQDNLTSLPTKQEEMPNSTSQSVNGLSDNSESQADSTQMLLSDSDQSQNFKKIQGEIFKQRTAASRLREKDPRTAMDMLLQARSRVSQNESLAENEKRPLFAMLDREIADVQKYIEQNFSDIQLAEKNEAVLTDLRESREKKYNAELQVQKLVEDFNDLMDEQRYAEANVIARQVADLMPDSQIAVQLRENATIATNSARMLQNKAEKEESFFERLYDVDRDTINNVTEAAPVAWGDIDRWSRNSRLREQWLSDRQYSSPEEAAIWNKLRNEKVQGRYQSTLNDAIDDLSQQTGINILFDDAALAAEAVSTSSSIDVPIRQPITLRSALNVILGNSGLTFIVEDEVIKVTTRDAQRKDVKPVTYYVGDLVTPIQNFQHSLNMSFMSPNGPVGQTGILGQTPSVPMANQNLSRISPMQIAGSTAGAPQALSQQLPGLNNNPILGGGFGSGQIQQGNPQYNTIGPQPLGGVSQQDFIPLMNLIRNTIDPDGWDDTNGDGTIQAFVPNLSLIVSQTQEVQDQIQDLLQQLRELNDVQIVVEVRFVSLADGFFERIGVDFDFNLNDNSGLAAGTVPPDEVAPSSVVGLEPGVNANVPQFNSDFDIPFQQSFFTSSLPQFGGFDVGSVANFGFAILSDIEVFFLLQASKGDSRTNITQAPTLTMFNGQVASVIDGAFVPFVTSVIPVVGDFAVAQQPVITILPEGTNLNVQAVVSNDRKSVRMTLVPYFSQIQNVDTFTFDGSTTTQRASDQTLLDDLLGVVTGDDTTDPPAELETVTEGVTIQLPTIGQTSVSTVVSVPDGGTILLGGIKRQTEQRLERGVPFLSNIPYVSRLFKNVGISRDTSSLMMMVSPRIIIQEEEELEQVGTQSRRRN